MPENVAMNGPMPDLTCLTMIYRYCHVLNSSSHSTNSIDLTQEN